MRGAARVVPVSAGSVTYVTPSQAVGSQTLKALGGVTGPMQRTCPRDRTPLVAQKVEGVTIDACPKCHGAFFDEGELVRVTGDKELKKYLATVSGKATSQVVCPACGGLMDLDKVEDVELDHCTRCYGVWLDGKELERIGARDPDAPIAGLRNKEMDAEERRFREMPRGGGDGRAAALGYAFRLFAWRLRRR